MTLEGDAAYAEAGAIANDGVDGTLDVFITGAVGSAAGTYTLTYTAGDASGNEAQVQRVVTVLEPEPEPGPEPEPPTGGNDADDQLVLKSGSVDGVWDRGINAFDQAIGYADCSNDLQEGRPLARALLPRQGPDRSHLGRRRPSALPHQ